MRKVTIVCGFFVLNIAQALKVHLPNDPTQAKFQKVDYEEELSDEYLQKMIAQYDPKLDWAPAPKTPSISAVIKRPEIRKGTGEHLQSGDAFALESEVEPGLFVTLRHGHPDDMGNPRLWCEMKHITSGIMGLDRGITPNSTFAFTKEGSHDIVSGDYVEWKHDLKQIVVQQQGWMWPYPLLLKESGNPFRIEHAREVDIKHMEKTPIFGFDEKTLRDPRKGEAIKDGDSVWMKYRDLNPSSGGIYMYLSGDVGEGGHVAFSHHFPGYDGVLKNYALEHWSHANDPHATGQRFTIRKISSQK